MLNKTIPAGSTLSFIVGPEDANQRLDVCIAQRFSHYSRSFFKRMVSDQAIRLNGTPITKAGLIVHVQDHIELTFPTPALEQQKEITVIGKPDISLIYQHEHFLILEKPAGWIVHAPHTYSKEVTVVDWLLAHFKELRLVGLADRPGIVHRLDKDTSGLLIIARTNYAHQQFSKMFREHTITKTYYALVQGHMPSKGAINFAIKRDPFVKVKMAVDQAVCSRARAALTHYRSLSYGPSHTLVECKPVTGRTHQIRVHCAAIGHPLVGDALYGKEDAERQALHAYKIAFAFESQPFEFCSPLPDDFKKMARICSVDLP